MERKRDRDGKKEKEKNLKKSTKNNSLERVYK